MKNRLEAELISIAHRILKLKNKSEVIQLQKETLNLYEKLSVLRFVEENYGDTSVAIPEDIQERITQPIQEEIGVIPVTETILEEKITIKEKTEEVIKEVPTEITETNVEIQTEDTTKKEASSVTFSFDERFEEFEAQLTNAKPEKTPTIFDQVVPVEESLFVPKSQQTQTKTTERVITSTTKNVSINDAVRKNFNMGLNDKIAFEFHLFGGKSEDFNRVLSQLNTFDTFAEAKDFIENMVKPDYNNWLTKDEYAERFMEIIESKF